MSMERSRIRMSALQETTDEACERIGIDCIQAMGGKRKTNAS